MKIVILDQANLHKSFEQFDYSQFEALGEVVCYPLTNSNEVLARAKDADVIITNKNHINRNLIEQLKTLKLICKAGTGYDNIDARAAREHDVAVANVPGYSTNIVAQWTMSLLLMLASNMDQYNTAAKNNLWQQQQFQFPIIELQNKILGIIGFGPIGKHVAKIAQSFGMQVLMHTNHPEPFAEVEFVDLEQLIKQADFISLHRRLTDKSRNMVNADFLKQMKPTSFLINTSRARLINEQDFIKAMQNKTIAGAGMDVFWQEPPEDNHPLFALDNVIITPHVAWASHETRQNLLNMLADNIKCFIEGKPINIVN